MWLMRIEKISYENHETHTWLLLAQTIFLFIMCNHVLEFLPHYLRETIQKHTFIQHENSTPFRALLVSNWIFTDDSDGLSDQNQYFILVFMFLTVLSIFPNCKWLHFYIQHKGYFIFLEKRFYFAVSVFSFGFVFFKLDALFPRALVRTSSNKPSSLLCIIYCCLLQCNIYTLALRQEMALVMEHSHCW